MKKKIFLLLSMIFVLVALALSISATSPIRGKDAPTVDKTYYLVKSAASDIYTTLVSEGKSVVALDDIAVNTDPTSAETIANPFFDQFAPGAHIEFILAEDLLVEYDENKGLLLNTNVTLTITLNGHAFFISSRGRRNGLTLYNDNATVRVIGNSEIAYDEKGVAIVTRPSISNGKIVSKGTTDIYHSGKVFAWIYKGTAYFEKINGFANEEIAFIEGKSNTACASFDGCTITSANFPICSSDHMPSTFYVYNTEIMGNVSFSTLMTGTWFENTHISGNFTMDCWNVSGQVATFKNTKIDGSITTESGRTHLVFIDCTFDISKMKLGSDGGGACYALVYTSVTCENDGSLNVYKNGKGTTPVNDDSKYAQTVIDFYNDPNNKAQGHINVQTVKFEGAKYVSSCVISVSCSFCGMVTESETISSMFESLGYSVPLFGTEFYISVCVLTNQGAISRYTELTGVSIGYGFAVAAKDRLGAGVSPLDENGDVRVLEAGKVLKAELTSYGTAAMDLKVGLNEANLNTELLMTAYIYESFEDGMTISYLQDANSLVENNSFSYVTYYNH